MTQQERDRYCSDCEFLESLRNNPDNDGLCVAVYGRQVIALASSPEVLAEAIFTTRVVSRRALGRVVTGYIGKDHTLPEVRERLNQRGYWHFQGGS